MFLRLTAALVAASADPERGDVPGWVLITGFLSNVSFGG